MKKLIHVTSRLVIPSTKKGKQDEYILVAEEPTQVKSKDETIQTIAWIAHKICPPLGNQNGFEKAAKGKKMTDNLLPTSIETRFD